ncbi:MAG: DUF2757 domain-containing protein [Sulfobacillus acidophilus]|uniref:DUF2757 domain-containing protein n=1 Tax=Sulfobacillus acidophilus TaxID=53633 RepID=A0A2T2WH59_9FIRM|nr:MAG: DUF2757 domain-containing protein [Sulfobacillus acidophilus]
MVRYVCRQCERLIGAYHGDWRDPALGLTDLEADEGEEVLQFNDTGEIVTVKLLCENCLPVPWDMNLWYN